MSPDVKWKMESDEIGFLGLLVILELLIVPCLPLGKYGGGIAMIALAIIGLPAYWVMFRDRLRSRGGLKQAVVILTVSVFVGVAIVAALQPFLR